MTNTRSGLHVNRGSNGDHRDVGIVKGKSSAGYNTVRISHTSTGDNNVPLHVGYGYRSSSCLKCSENHSLDQGQKFEDKDVSEKKGFVLKQKLCKVCLKANHVAEKCQSPRPYLVEGCGWRYHTLLHMKWGADERFRTFMSSLISVEKQKTELKSTKNTLGKESPSYNSYTIKSWQESHSDPRLFR
ncbi:unnamed protein product [Schistosoma curassoni]|uniref:Transcription factor interactor and regulator CCHC(Zn) family n=1 Tax=Schistosoma curassoni TaxID=6186 RepID=A0A183JYX6_9TREM|nr:unnamed protein product [Schistosoma curassoni]